MSSQYHATIVPALYAGFVVITGLVLRRSRGGALAVVAQIALGAVLGAFKPAYDGFMVGPFGSIQFDRVGLFAPMACLCLAGAIQAQSAGRWLRWPLGVSLGFFMLSAIGLSPATLKPLLPATAKQVLAEARDTGEYAMLLGPRGLGGVDLNRNTLYRAATVGGHFRASAYGCIAAAVGAARVISVGIDPMIAAANGIRVLDGYHNLYPLEYKHAFRPVIAAKIAASPDLQAYYDDWGNRIYTFADRAPEAPIDFRAAAGLGAAYAISNRALDGLPEQHLPCLSGADVRLYRLVMP